MKKWLSTYKIPYMQGQKLLPCACLPLIEELNCNRLLSFMFYLKLFFSDHFSSVGLFFSSAFGNFISLNWVLNHSWGLVKRHVLLIANSGHIL